MAAPPARLSRAHLAALGIALFVSYAYFYEAGGWNQNTRFDLVRAILGQHSLQIDRYAYNTGDKAVLNGHTYSDKAPGLALTAVPVTAVARLAVKAAGVDPESHDAVAALSYAATALVNGAATAAAGIVIAMLAARLFGSGGAGAFTAIVFGLGTPMWAYATLFQEHALAASCLVMAYGAAVALGAAAGPRARTRLAVGVGLLTGWATVSSLTCSVPAVLIAALALWQARGGRSSLTSAVLGVGAGATACLAVLLIYNGLAFGAPFHIAYSNEAGFEELRSGFFGITYPKPRVMGELLVGSFRGLLPLSPILALAPVGWWVWLRRRSDGAALLVAILIPIYYLLLNSSYYYWEGGWSFGPRHMAPALPFLALAAGALWARASRPWRWPLAGLAIVSIGLTLVGVSVTPQPPVTYTRPMAELWWPAFKDGDLSVNHTSFDMYGWNPEQVRHHPEVHEAWNLGEKAGLRGLSSLGPLPIVWLVAAAWLFPSRRAAPGGPPRAVSSS